MENAMIYKVVFLSGVYLTTHFGAVTVIHAFRGLRVTTVTLSLFSLGVTLLAAAFFHF